MKTQNNTNFESFNLLSFYLAPLVLLAATVAKSIEGGVNFKASIAGGVLTCFAFILFLFVVLQLTAYAYHKLPRFAFFMRILMVYTCFVGFTFGLDGILMAVSDGDLTFWEINGAMIFPMSGILWPLSLIIFGGVCYAKKVLPLLPAGLLILSGILFPMGRIPGNELLYYAGDISFIITFFFLARYLRTGETSRETSSTTTPMPEVA